MEINPREGKMDESNGQKETKDRTLKIGRATSAVVPLVAPFADKSYAKHVTPCRARHKRPWATNDCARNSIMEMRHDGVVGSWYNR